VKDDATLPVTLSKLTQVRVSDIKHQFSNVKFYEHELQSVTKSDQGLSF
jgi:hypothetical protein